MRHQWRIGFKNLLRNRRRSLATALSIAVGFAGLMFTFGYILRIERYLSVAQIYLGRTGHLLVYHEHGLEQHLVKPLLYSLTPDEQQKIAGALQGDPDVERFSAYLVVPGLLSNGCSGIPFQALGVDPGMEKWLYGHPEVQAWTPELATFTRGKGLWGYQDVQGAIAVANGLARRANKPKVHDDIPPGSSSDPVLLDCLAPDAQTRIGSDANVQLAAGSFTGEFAAMDGEIVNQFTTGFTEFENSLVIARLTDLQQLYETDRVTYMAVFLKDSSNLEGRAAALERRLRAGGLAVSVYPWTNAEISPVYAGVIQMLSVIGTFILVILISVVGLSIANSMTMAVLERSREFGTLRALGYTPRHILRLLLIEVMLLTGAGIAAGLLMGEGAAKMVEAARIRFTPPSVVGSIQFMVTPTVRLCVAIALLLIGCALTATVLTARRQLRQRIVTLLHGGMEQ